MRLLVNPQKSWDNAPDIEVYDFEFPEFNNSKELIWENKERCYFTQQPSGYTDFLFHDNIFDMFDPVEIDEATPLVTRNNGGYGGGKFPIKLRIDGKIIPYTLVGPWSGGCYAANEYLPRKCCEVAMMGRQYHQNAYIPIDMINAQFEAQQSKWRVVDGNIGIWEENEDKCYWVEPFFDGVRKKLMDEATKNALNDVWVEGKCF